MRDPDPADPVRLRLQRLFGDARRPAARPPALTAADLWPGDPADDAAGGPSAGPANDRACGPPGLRGHAAGSGAAGRTGALGAFDPGRRGVKALVAVAAVVALVAAVTVWRLQPHPEPLAVAGEPGAPAPVRPTAAVSPARLVVAVAGKVRRPGLVQVPAGARVADVLAAAGGALPGTDVTLLNLARKVTDGELVVVGGPAGSAQAPGVAGGAAGPAAPVSLNTATTSQLDALPGVGPVLAQRILDYRQRHGAFRSVSELRQVDGIGQARYEQLKELITL